MKALSNTASSARGWPARILRCAEFAVQIARYHPPNRGPQDVSEAQQMINDAAKESFTSTKRRPAATDCEKLYWATRLLRAVRAVSDWGIRVAGTAWPELAEHLHPRDHHILASLHEKVRVLAEGIAEQ
jgi:hypothetical protein